MFFFINGLGVNVFCLALSVFIGDDVSTENNLRAPALFLSGFTLVSPSLLPLLPILLSL